MRTTSDAHVADGSQHIEQIDSPEILLQNWNDMTEQEREDLKQGVLVPASQRPCLLDSDSICKDQNETQQTAESTLRHSAANSKEELLQCLAPSPQVSLRFDA